MTAYKKRWKESSWNKITFYSKIKSIILFKNFQCLCQILLTFKQKKVPPFLKRNNTRKRNNNNK